MKFFSILILLTFFFLCSCRSSIEESRATIQINMRGVEADPETSSFLISLGRELRIAYDYFLRGDFTRALRVYKKVARGYMKYDYRHRLATIYSNIGSIFLKLNQLKQAKNYFEISTLMGEENILDPTERLRLKAVNYYKFALIHLFQNKPEKCKEFNDKSYKINTQISNIRGLAKNFRVYGLYFYNKKKKKIALKYFIDALQININVNYHYDIILNRLSVGKIFFDEKKYTQALKFFNLALIVAKQQEIAEKISQVLFNIGSLFEVQKKYKKALEYYKRSYESDINREGNETLRKIRIEAAIKKIKSMYTKLNKPRDFAEFRKRINFFYYRRFQD